MAKELTAVGAEVTENVGGTGVVGIAELLVSGDMGCLLDIAGRLKRMGSPVRAYHLADLLAGMTDRPGIGEGGEK